MSHRQSILARARPTSWEVLDRGDPVGENVVSHVPVNHYWYYQANLLRTPPTVSLASMRVVRRTFAELRNVFNINGGGCCALMVHGYSTYTVAFDQAALAQWLAKTERSLAKSQWWWSWVGRLPQVEQTCQRTVALFISHS